jgi:hypothetical protein
MFRHGWVPAEGTVIDIRWSGHQSQVGGDGQVPHFLMDVRPGEGPPFRAEVDELALMFSFKPPGIGQVVKLECDPHGKRARFIRSDPAINHKQDQRAANAAYDALRDAGPGQ